MEMRRIAILVSGMEPETAEQLLAELPEDQQVAIRNAVQELDDISDEELDDVTRELQSVAVESEVDELCGDRALPPVSVTPLDGTVVLSPHPHRGEDRLASVVRSASAEMLLRVLNDEYPQTLAAVVMKLAPDGAAQFLAGLSDATRTDVMQRVAEMDIADDDVLDELSEELSKRLDSELARVDGTMTGRDAIKAILFAAQGDQRDRLIASLTSGEPRLATQLGVTCSSTSKADLTMNMETERMPPPSPASTEELETWTFEHVLRLEGDRLADLVRSADFEVVVLALVGASPSQTERFLSGLSTSEASRFRRRLSAIGPVRLRDIELAQRQLAVAAQRATIGVAQDEIGESQSPGGPDPTAQRAKSANRLMLSI